MDFSEKLFITVFVVSVVLVSVGAIASWMS